ncbi:hypothetical protein SEMRO_3271_G346090.1 [Seminavis robusta]|uniref:Uncharacterized protein n=1 Tax=Seminavis robusta TaxID=568900 RepID=A0A9N8F1Z2_9STRA|nr:hypothetical protein SEMRO_3271_G346090.1 [Seminavis robusta]|eukprot:Sro3271_g346090.1 n/a (268) ;mRNA; r:6017-6820
MLPFCNDFPDTFIYDRLFKLKLILLNPFTEAHKTTQFCDIWGYNKDEYINRYHRWLGDIDLLTEGVEEPVEAETSSDSSNGSDLVNAGGVNLRKLERLIDNGSSSPGSGQIIFDYDCGGTEDGNVKPAAVESPILALGSPRLDVAKLAKLDEDIDEILLRPIRWGIMTQLPADEDAKQDPDASEEPDAKPAAKEDSEVTQEETDSSNTQESNSEESEEEESPKKKQKTSEDEVTIDGDETEDNEANNDETDEAPYGVEILCTGSFSY